MRPISGGSGPRDDWYGNGPTRRQGSYARHTNCRDIQAEMERVTKASGTGMPAWLGSPRPGLLGLDYSRYKPRGFYAEVPVMASYFRAVSWLQSIPFRIDQDEELLASAMLGNAIAKCRFGNDAAKQKVYEAYFHCYRQFIGDNDDWDLVTAAHAVPKELHLDLEGDDLRKLRDSFRKITPAAEHTPVINDLLTYSPKAPTSFRVLSAYRTPDSVLFGRTTNPGVFNREFPSGLEVCVALGSSFAETKLDDPEHDKLVATIRQSRDIFAGSSLYFDYMHCLSALLDKPASEAPAFMSSDPWRAKSCQTVLGGWAQLRNCWALQAKQDVFYIPDKDDPPPAGFIEPNPTFFARMATLVASTETLLKTTGAFEFASNGHDIIPEIRAIVTYLEKRASQGAKGLDNKHDWSEESDFVRRLQGLRIEDVNSLPDTITKLNALAEEISHGKVPEGLQSSGGFGNIDAGDLQPRWERLDSLCKQLEMLASKQLQRLAFTKVDNDFFLSYGDRLSRVLLHAGEFSPPRDDTPGVIDVFANPIENKYLEVGIGRPHLFYVLYPAGNDEVFCCGAILPYHEFVYPSRLNDTEWKDLLDSPQAPTEPAWVQGSFAPATWIDRHLGDIISIGSVLCVVIAGSIAWIAIRRRTKRRLCSNPSCAETVL